MLIYLQMIETPEDQSEFERLYIKYRGLMYHIAYGILKNTPDAEDAVHNAFLQLAKNMHRLTANGRTFNKTFFVTLAEHHSIDLLRKRNRHPSIPLEEVEVGVPFTYTGTDQLAACIAKLPPTYRYVINLKYLLGFSNTDISCTLGLSPSNTDKINQRAKNRLRELCTKEGLL